MCDISFLFFFFLVFFVFSLFLCEGSHGAADSFVLGVYSRQTFQHTLEEGWIIDDVRVVFILIILEKKGFTIRSVVVSDRDAHWKPDKNSELHSVVDLCVYHTSNTPQQPRQNHQRDRGMGICP